MNQPVEQAAQIADALALGLLLLGTLAALLTGMVWICLRPRKQSSVL